MNQGAVISPPFRSFMKPNGEKYGSLYSSLINVGRTGLIFRQGDRTLKYPRTDDLDTIPADNHAASRYLASINREDLQREIMIYERLGRHEGIIEYFGASEDESIELSFAKQGDLQSYIKSHPEKSADAALKTKWALSMTDTLTYIHSRRVLVDDIATRNFLIDNDNQLMFSDFGASSILPLDADMDTAIAYGLTAKIDILHLGWAMYSVAIWETHNYNYFLEEVWPLPEDLPRTENIIWGAIIRKCWEGHFKNMEEVKADVHALLDG